MSAPDEITLRPVVLADVPVFYDHQADAGAAAMAAFPSRDRATFTAHWQRILAGDGETWTILSAGEVAGNLLSWDDGDRRLVGYWIGRDFWGRGVATRALALFVAAHDQRPLHALVAKHNVGSIRVLQKCGFECEGEGEHEHGDGGVEEWLYVLRS